MRAPRASGIDGRMKLRLSSCRLSWREAREREREGGEGEGMWV